MDILIKWFYPEEYWAIINRWDVDSAMKCIGTKGEIHNDITIRDLMLAGF